MKKSLALSVTEGFTLLEMLVVLGIIALILSILSVSFSTTQKKSRDAKRKGDLKALQNGMEQYYSQCGYVYPTGALPLGTPMGCTAAPNIVPVIPSDPKTGATYDYGPTPSGTASNITSYDLCTTLESETPSSYCTYSQQ